MEADFTAEILGDDGDTVTCSGYSYSVHIRSMHSTPEKYEKRDKYASGPTDDVDTVIILPRSQLSETPAANQPRASYFFEESNGDRHTISKISDIKSRPFIRYSCKLTHA